jgi:hypothetical protein
MSKVIVPRGAVELAVNQSGKLVRPKIEPSLVRQFKKIREEMLSEFNQHPVTRELDQKTSSDPSEFVSHGSLFGFIGFEKSDDPAQSVREMLEKSELSFIKTNRGVIDFKAFYPSKEELFAQTPMPWASGRSWLKGIESGISGLGKYLNIDSDISRSGGGMQSEYTVRSARFKATEYISKILNNFIKNIEKLSL